MPASGTCAQATKVRGATSWTDEDLAEAMKGSEGPRKGWKEDKDKRGREEERKGGREEERKGGREEERKRGREEARKIIPKKKKSAS